MRIHLPTGARIPCTVLCLLSLALLIALVVGGPGRVLASVARDGPPPNQAVLLAALQGGGNHSASGRTIPAATTDGQSDNATLGSLTLTSEGGPIPL